MSRARLVITAVTRQGLRQAAAARTYGVSEATVSRLIARYWAEGEAVFEPRSQAPKTSPQATPPATVTLRVAGQLHHFGLGRTHTGTHVILLIQDYDVRVINAITGGLLRELTIDTYKDYQPRK